MQKLIKKIIISCFVLYSLLFTANASNITANVAILSTTDLHGYMLNYDYFTGQKSNKVGLNRLATVINNYRTQYKNNMLLVDSGDLIQGSALAEYMIKNIDLSVNTHPIMEAFAYLKYDSISIGNHEFNYGLDTLDNIIKHSAVPLINYNIYNINPKTNKPTYHKYQKYHIASKKIMASDGKEYVIKFGIVGLLPPKILSWDKAYLEGKVWVGGFVQEAKKAVEELQGKVDFIVIVVHSGISDNPRDDENTLTQLAKIRGVDYLIGGHSHVQFPNANNNFFNSIEGVNPTDATIYNVPTLVAGYHGQDVGVMETMLALQNNKWVIVNTVVTVSSSNIEDKTINKIFSNYHKATLKYINTPIANVNSNLNNYFALVQDDYTIEIVNNAQIEYIKNLQATTLNKYSKLPVLSAHSPFKNGGRMGSDYYTAIKKGKITFSNAADLYVYPNTLYVLKINGAELKEFLEWSTQIYNELSETTIDEQELINDRIPSYAYDIVDGVTYTINITKPNRYHEYNLINANSYRIENLSYNGSAVKEGDEFLIAVNNYRANTNPIINNKGMNVILDTAIESRTILIDYIKRKKALEAIVNYNWRLEIGNAKNIIFYTSNKAKSLNNNVIFVSSLPNGFGKFALLGNN